MILLPRHLTPGAPHPMGATWDGLGVNFAVFSANATRMELCVFEPSGRREIARYDMPEYTDEVWHGYLPEARAGLLYGFRAHGPYDPQRGHRFNPNKLLLDPYARALHGEVRWTDALFGYRLHSPRADLSFDRRDSAPAMPKCVVTDESFSWGNDQPPNVPWSETVIYEAHVRGLTKLFDKVRPPARGTFAALAHPDIIKHLQRLGVTALELMPVQAYLQDRILLEKGLSNYWGYNTLCFFAPEQRYISPGETRDEFKVAIRRLHAAGIEVILDVVYNHTCEGSELGPTLCWRGLDNASYYRPAENPRYVFDDTGTGNSLDLTCPLVLRMVIDSLRYWAEVYHVDGFRFDLGVTLGRERHGFDPGAGFFDVLRQDPVLSRLKLISEPWDVGPGGYQLGAHPPGFAEWNDKYRDDVRRYWKGENGARADMASRVAGSGEVFDRKGRRPWASINFLASHDGFTLADVTRYERKHNEANGEDNRDGHAANFTCNWGVEGDTDDPRIQELRNKIVRAMLTSLFASAGTPMLLAGDEFGRTQGGNNNAYNQDNDINWLDWSLRLSGAGAALYDFVSRLAAARRRYEALRPARHLHGEDEPIAGLLNLDWFDRHANRLTEMDWRDGEQKTLLMRRAVRKPNGTIECAALLLNASSEATEFLLPPPKLPWWLLIDSAQPTAGTRPLDEGRADVAAHAATILIAELRGGRRG